MAKPITELNDTDIPPYKRPGFDFEKANREIDEVCENLDKWIDYFENNEICSHEDKRNNS